MRRVLRAKSRKACGWEMEMLARDAAQIVER